jgi:phosphotransferase system  glucose/maltose/N-acetylglucosamine-specific IIC component
MEDVGIFYGPLANFTANWYILLLFGIFWSFGVCFPVLVYFTKKNLATLEERERDRGWLLKAFPCLRDLLFSQFYF